MTKDWAEQKSYTLLVKEKLHEVIQKSGESQGIVIHVILGKYAHTSSLQAILRQTSTL